MISNIICRLAGQTDKDRALVRTWEGDDSFKNVVSGSNEITWPRNAWLRRILQS